MGENFDSSASQKCHDCSHVLLADTRSKPQLRKTQSDGNDQDPYGQVLPGGVTVQDLVYRYTPSKFEIEQENWGPKHKGWEKKTADFIRNNADSIRENPDRLGLLNAGGFVSKVVDTAFDVGTQKLFDQFLENVNNDLKKDGYTLSVRQDAKLLAEDQQRAAIFHGESPDFAGYLDLKDKSGTVLGSIRIQHTPIPGTRFLV